MSLPNAHAEHRWRRVPGRSDRRLRARLHQGPLSHQVIELAATGQLGMAAAGQIRLAVVTRRDRSPLGTSDSYRVERGARRLKARRRPAVSQAGIWVMTRPVSMSGTWATTSPDGFMTHVGPYPTWVSQRS